MFQASMLHSSLLRSGLPDAELFDAELFGAGLPTEALSTRSLLFTDNLRSPGSGVSSSVSSQAFVNAEGAGGSVTVTATGADGITQTQSSQDFVPGAIAVTAVGSASTSPGTNVNGTDVNGTNVNGTDVNGTNVINGTTINTAVEIPQGTSPGIPVPEPSPEPPAPTEELSLSPESPESPEPPISSDIPSGIPSGIPSENLGDPPATSLAPEPLDLTEPQEEEVSSPEVSSPEVSSPEVFFPEVFSPVEPTPPEKPFTVAPEDSDSSVLDPLTGLDNTHPLLGPDASDSLAPQASSISISFNNTQFGTFIQDFLNLVDRATPLSPVSIRLEFGTSIPGSGSGEETTELGSASLNFTISGNGLAEKTFGIRLPTILG